MRFFCILFLLASCATAATKITFDENRVLEVDGLRIRVADLEALDGTPVVDVKPVLRGDGS